MEDMEDMEDTTGVNPPDTSEMNTPDMSEKAAEREERRNEGIRSG